MPTLERDEALTPHLARIRELYAACRGNLVRVFEELRAEGADVQYSTVTAFCRRHGIGVKPAPRAGRYIHEPGEEMQHDTSPHKVEVAGRMRQLECAELILCHSRRIFAQVYPRWSRFECKAFFTAALRYFGGAADRCVIDNSSVVIARGSGRDAAMAPEMEAFAKRFGFIFHAHEVGDKDRSGKVERNFHYIENNFYPGRSFESLADLNDKLRAWCDKVNASPRKLWGESKRVPDELFSLEAPLLRPLPLHIPEVYRVHERRVDVEGHITLDTNRYSVPLDIREGRRLEIHETLDTLRIFDGRRLACEHERCEPGAKKRNTLPEHRHDGRKRKARHQPVPQEAPLRKASPALAALIDNLKKRDGGRAARSIQRLYQMYLDYPTEYLAEAAAEAGTYGLYDLRRIESMTLSRIRGDFFRLPTIESPDPEEGDG